MCSGECKCMSGVSLCFGTISTCGKLSVEGEGFLWNTYCFVIWLMAPGKRSPLVETIRKAGLRASSRKCLTELKKENKQTKNSSASSDVWVAEAHAFGEDPEFSSLLFLWSLNSLCYVALKQQASLVVQLQLLFFIFNFFLKFNLYFLIKSYSIFCLETLFAFTSLCWVLLFSTLQQE